MEHILFIHEALRTNDEIHRLLLHLLGEVDGTLIAGGDPELTLRQLDAS